MCKEAENFNTEWGHRYLRDSKGEFNKSSLLLIDNFRTKQRKQN